MNKEEFCEQIKPHVEKYIDGFYDEKFEGANIRQILNIAEQYAKSNVSKQLAEKDAEIEKLKAFMNDLKTLELSTVPQMQVSDASKRIKKVFEDIDLLKRYHKLHEA